MGPWYPYTEPPRLGDACDGRAVAHDIHGEPVALIGHARATYRVQLHSGFTFDDAASIVPYLSRLGVSHLYCSPILQAAPGSTHGYDVVDHERLDDELGGPSGWERLTRAVVEHDLSIALDIVPNHMALAGRANRWWWDVLENGPSSRFASHFDIDWGDARSGPSVLAPVLGDHYGRVLEAGGFHLARSRGSFTVRYEEHELPLSRASLEDLLERASRRAGSEDDLDAAIDAELAATESDPDALDALLTAQSYRLAHWRTASEELDYRRFFDVSSLVGLRAEDPAVFEDTHRLVLDLVAARHVSILRVDHVDGLRDPAGYLDHLGGVAAGAGVVVEKILAPDERLPGTWPVEGTSGYDFLIRVGDLFVDGDGVTQLRALHTQRTGDDRSFAEVAADAKRHVMDNELAAETDRLTELLVQVCRARRRHRDHTRRELREVLVEVVVALDVYRTYVAPGRSTARGDRARVRESIDAIRERRPDLDGELLLLLERILVLEEPGSTEHELAVRFQQLSAPVMAKGVEDTAFYRYVPLLALNEVGGHPARVGGGVEPFHEHNRHIAACWPRTMLTVSTHDTKRSADVRARLALLSEIPRAWDEAVRTWMEHNGRHRRDGWPDAVTELVLYQSLVGAWPIEPHRIEAVMHKSIKEAKVHTSWRQPDDAYEEAVLAFVRDVVADAEFVGLLERFLTEHALVRLGRMTSLSQVALLLTSPGVPDLYQGDELWDLSLVDPDNRRPVDFDARRALLDQITSPCPTGRRLPEAKGLSKLWLIHELLDHRRRHPHLYDGGYEPLRARGPKADHAVAFSRGGLVTVVPRLVLTLDRTGWGDTTIALPAGTWRSVLHAGDELHGEVPVAAVLGHLPVAVLERAS
jgi:(1->4)-alpha-D-glucan 1-alpha-D-glucosylmutase